MFKFKREGKINYILLILKRMLWIISEGMFLVHMIGTFSENSIFCKKMGRAFQTYKHTKKKWKPEWWQCSKLWKIFLTRVEAVNVHKRITFHNQRARNRRFSYISLNNAKEFTIIYRKISQTGIDWTKRDVLKWLRIKMLIPILPLAKVTCILNFKISRSEASENA